MEEKNTVSMPETVEEYIKILYPDIDSLTSDERKKVEKDKSFMEEYWDDVVERYQEYADQIEKYGVNEYSRIILNLCKEDFDPETVISDYVKSIASVLKENSFISNDFNSFINTIRFGREKEDEYKDVQIDDTPIDLNTVIRLTEEFLEMIDESNELANEFRRLKENGGIELISPDSKKSSHYSHCENKIRYKFDGTVNSAYTLVHEFMHHVCTTNSETAMGYHDFTAFREYLSIYYETAFIDFMDENGLLPNGKEPVIAKRLQDERAMDPDNCFTMLLECYPQVANGKKIEREDIETVLKSHFPDIEDSDELWKHGTNILMQFCNEHWHTLEVGAGLTMYKFGTAIAHSTPRTPELIRNIHKLAYDIKNGEHDLETLQKTQLIISQSEHQNNQPTLTTMDIARRTLPNASLDDKNFISRMIGRWRDRLRNGIGGDISD